MLSCPLHAAYKAKGVILWVTPSEIATLLRGMHYAESVRMEISEWIARLMSMTFVAGQRGTPIPKITRHHLRRLLDRMGYCPPNAKEIEDFVFNYLPSLYNKGMTRVGLK